MNFSLDSIVSEVLCQMSKKDTPSERWVDHFQALLYFAIARLAKSNVYPKDGRYFEEIFPKAISIAQELQELKNRQKCIPELHLRLRPAFGLTDQLKPETLIDIFRKASKGSLVEANDYLQTMVKPKQCLRLKGIPFEVKDTRSETNVVILAIQ